MSKSAAEWVDSLTLGRAGWEALVQAIIDDARAGMVPEGELAALRKRLEETEAAKSRDSINGDCIMLMREHLARVGIESTFADDAADMAAQTIEKLQTELAKARAGMVPEGEAGVLTPQLMVIKQICCGRDAGHYFATDWKHAEDFREAYCSGPGVSDPEHSAVGGHERVAVITTFKDWHEAELAKAWEAGKKATLEATAAFVPAVVWSSLSARLQPPGGKAK